MKAACAVVARRIVARMESMEAFWMVPVDDVIARDARSYRSPRAYFRAATLALVGPDVSARRPYRISRRKSRPASRAEAIERGASLMEHVIWMQRKRVGGVVRLPSPDAQAARSWRLFHPRIRRRLLTALRFVVFARAAQCAQFIVSEERPPF